MSDNDKYVTQLTNADFGRGTFADVGHDPARELHEHERVGVGVGFDRDGVGLGGGDRRGHRLCPRRRGCEHEKRQRDDADAAILSATPMVHPVSHSARPWAQLPNDPCRGDPRRPPLDYVWTRT
jgi:hypothetical protein